MTTAALSTIDRCEYGSALSINGSLALISISRLPAGPRALQLCGRISPRMAASRIISREETELTGNCHGTTGDRAGCTDGPELALQAETPSWALERQTFLHRAGSVVILALRATRGRRQQRPSRGGAGFAVNKTGFCHFASTWLRSREAEACERGALASSSVFFAVVVIECSSLGSVDLVVFVSGKMICSFKPMLP